MKNILRKSIYGLVALAGLFIAACSTTDEIMDSVPYRRVLTPQDFTAKKIESVGTTYTFSWTGIQNTDHYVLEIFSADKDSTDPADYEEAVPVWSSESDLDEKITSGRIDVDLPVDQTFFARVRAVSASESVEPSHWAYLEKTFSTSAVRSSLNPAVEERYQKEITITWDAADDDGDITSIRVEYVVPVEGKSAVDYPVSSGDISAHKKTLDNLEVATEYKFTLVFGKDCRRGYVTAWTRPNLGDYQEVTSAEQIANLIKTTKSGELRLKLPYKEGQEYDLTPYLEVDDATDNGHLKVNCDLYIAGETAADGKKPVVTNAEFRLFGGSKFHFEDISFNGSKVAGSTVFVTAVDLDTVRDIEFVELVNCDIYDYTKGIYAATKTYAQGGSNEYITANVKKVLIKGVYAHDINAAGSVGGDFIDARTKGTHSDIEVLNSTFYACARTFLRVSDSSKAGKIAVANTTFNFVTSTISNSNNAGIFNVRETTEVQAMTLSNCLFMNMYNSNEKAGAKNGWVRLARDNATQNYAPVSTKNYIWNYGDSFFATKAMLISSGASIWDNTTDPAPVPEGWTVLADDPCVNSEAGKLYLANSDIAEKQIGDPRWWNAVQPKVERATELTAVTETTVWDFTDKTKFDSESIVENQIIENIRIYAPAEVMIGEGVKFMSAANVNDFGIPSSSALGFLASGVGSVKITTLDGGFNASVQVLVGEDRYTTLADGKEHTVVLGDLKGENNIYVVAGSAVTITKVEWSTDLTPEESVKALDAPKVSLSPSSVSVGDETEVVAAWDAVANADTYEVTFNGQKTTTTDLTYTVEASAVAALSTGDYEISVIAKPVSTSTKYTASAAGVAKLKVNPKTGTKTLTWDFSSPEWQAALSAKGSAGTDITNWDITIDGLQWYSPSASRWNPTNIQSGNKGSTTDRFFKFTAPAPGTLKVWSSNTGGSEAPDRGVTVNVGGVETSKFGGSASSVQTENEFEIGSAGDVYVYAYGGGLRFYKLEFTYADGGAGAAEPTVWDFASAEWQAEFAAKAASAKGTNQDNWTVSLDGLTYTSSSGNGKWDASGFIQPNGGGDKTKRVFSFKATTDGTLKVTAATASSGNARAVNVEDESGEKQTQDVDAQTTLEFEVVAGDVFIYPGGGIRFYKIEFTGGVEK